jgi:ribosomal-protein-alanine N-acetyltransferase
MSEALAQVVDYGFKIMNLHSIEAKLDPRNLASAAVAKKTGFVQEGYLKENYFVSGAFADTAIYSILNPD